ncbi:MAG: ATP-binding cassette domain-containing protein [Propionibacteriaceae bacterium]|jgi:ABC-type sulfate/molybdate transport systems ATPase subunit|nr:ATP-binding cassette domain-containing protein [Propionibacteriaceae bacterium]
MLDAQIIAHRGSFDLDVTLGAESSQVVCLVGPNGSGKSTLLASISGQLRADGHINFDGHVLMGGRHPVPAHKRGFAWMGQNPAVFPHLSVVRNIEFGIRAPSRSQTRAILEQTLTDFDLIPLAGRLGSELSGGQKARLALARVFATSPALVLLDEPCAALDVDAAAELRTLISQKLRSEHVTALIATHSLLDLTAWADRVVVVDKGHLVEQGNMDTILRFPRTTFLQSLAQVGVVTGKVHQGTFRSDTGLAFLAPEQTNGPALASIPAPACWATAVDPSRSPDPSGELQLASRLTAFPPQNRAPNIVHIMSTIDHLSEMNGQVTIHVPVLPAVPIAVSSADLARGRFGPGMPVCISVNTAQVDIGKIG